MIDYTMDRYLNQLFKWLKPFLTLLVLVVNINVYQ